MNAKSEKPRGTKTATGSRALNGGERKRPVDLGSQLAQHKRYMISPIGYDVAEEQLIQLVQDFGGIDIIRTLAACGTDCPPVAVVRSAPEKVAAFDQSTGGTFVIELDELLRAASPALSPSFRTPSVASAWGPGFTTSVQVLDEGDNPVARAEVQLVGQQWTAQGITGADGQVMLTLFGELPETVVQLLVKPRTGYWALWICEPRLKADTVNIVVLRHLPTVNRLGWAGQAMQFDRLPPEWRGAGVKIGLIDSGVSTSHNDLASISSRFDARGERTSWSDDPMGHGTLCAGILSATSDADNGIRGYAPDAELYVCKLGAAARCSDLAAALDHCIGAGIDLGCLSFGCQQGCVIVEHRIVVAKQRGMALIAAAGSTGGPVQFPASSRHVLAVGAIGQTGTFPDDSPHAAHARTAACNNGFFVPAFSCGGPQVDLCAPGVCVISCQSPDGYAAADGTSLAAPHVAALAALMLAHRADFQSDYANHDARRVERLFQILKETAWPLGYAAQTGAGLPNASRALGLQSPAMPFFTPSLLGLEELRNAMQLASLAEPGRGEALRGVPEPPIQAPTGIDMRMRDLKVAMDLAGLSEG